MFILLNLLFIVHVDIRSKFLVVFISTGTLLKWGGGSVTLLGLSFYRTCKTLVNLDITCYRLC